MQTYYRSKKNKVPLLYPLASLPFLEQMGFFRLLKVVHYKSHTLFFYKLQINMFHIVKHPFIINHRFYLLYHTNRQYD